MHANTMKIDVKLFALLGKYLPEGAKGNEAQIDVEDGVSVTDVLAALEVPPEQCRLVLVNGIYLAPSERDGRTLKEGDALAVWPPVAGG